MDIAVDHFDDRKSAVELIDVAGNISKGRDLPFINPDVQDQIYSLIFFFLMFCS